MPLQEPIRSFRLTSPKLHIFNLRPLLSFRRLILLSDALLTFRNDKKTLKKLHSKVHSARLQAAVHFENDHAKNIKDFNFKRGDLVLVRNTKIEKSLNRKMRPRYNGPLIVVSRNYGGAYIISELDGTVFHEHIAAFHVVPYFARRSIPLPDDLIDISTSRLREMESSVGEEGEEEDIQPDGEDSNPITE